MPDVTTLPPTPRTFLRAYPWRRIDPVPCARLSKPMVSCRVALVSTAGLVPPGAPPFGSRVRGGDYWYRVIPRDGDTRELVDSRRSGSYDHAGAARDRHLASPLDRLRELAAECVIGEVAPHHLSFTGSITAPERLVRDTAPDAAALLVGDGVDVALPIPVRRTCHEVVGLVQAELERRGIVTASLTMLPDITRKIRPPRVLAVPYPLGYPLGGPDDPALQRTILRVLLNLCTEAILPVLRMLGP